MATITFDTNSAKARDSQWMLWAKRVRQAGSEVLPTDTIWMLKRKYLKTLTG